MTWLFDWSACIFAGCLGHGWRTPKGWIAHKAEMVRQEAAWRKIEERARELRVQQALADVPPIVYHRDTPSKEPVVISAPDPLQPSATFTSKPAFMDQLPNPTSVIYLYVVEENNDGDYQVMRASSENPTVPNLNSEECEDDDDFGTFDTSERALAVAKKLNDEERARRFA